MDGSELTRTAQAYAALTQTAGAAALGLRCFTAAQYDVTCNEHGPMGFRPDDDRWGCPGWDGEGCPAKASLDAVTAGAGSGAGWRVAGTPPLETPREG